MYVFMCIPSLCVVFSRLWEKIWNINLVKINNFSAIFYFKTLFWCVCCGKYHSQFARSINYVYFMSRIIFAFTFWLCRIFDFVWNSSLVVKYIIQKDIFAMEKKHNFQYLLISTDFCMIFFTEQLLSISVSVGIPDFRATKSSFSLDSMTTILFRLVHTKCGSQIGNWLWKVILHDFCPFVWRESVEFPVIYLHFSILHEFNLVFTQGEHSVDEYKTVLNFNCNYNSKLWNLVHHEFVRFI